MKKDGRRYNDNSRLWNNEIHEKRKDAITSVCKLILKKNEPKTFAHIAYVLKQQYDDSIAVKAQTLSSNISYRNIRDGILFSENENYDTRKKYKHKPRSIAELENELFKQSQSNLKKSREIKLLRHQIKKSNIGTNNNEYTLNDLSNKTFDIDLAEILREVTNELLIYGDFYLEKGKLIRERDGKVFLTKELVLKLEIGEIHENKS